MSDRLSNIIIVVLSVAIFIVMVLSAVLPSLSYFQSQDQSIGGIVLGEANFEFINDLPLFSNLTNYSGGEINESVQVINARDKQGKDTTNLIDCYLRFRTDTTDSLVSNVDSSTYYYSNGYYYYIGTFRVGQTLELIKSFNVDTATEEEYLNGIDIEVVVEVIQATKSLVRELFVDAPTEWLNLI